jgi:hypothetical protein
MQHQPTNAHVVRGLSNHDYHAQTSISKSGLDLIRKAPAVYKWRRDNPQPPTPAMRMGTLVHTAILEPDSMSELLLAPTVDRRTSAGKAEWAAFLIESEGREIVTADELEQLSAIRDAVWSHPACGKALGMIAEVETSIGWTLDGIDCRCRPDAILTNSVILDVKTTRGATADEFVKSVAQYRYHVQAAFYSDGYKAAFGEAPKGFLFVAVETEVPHLCACYVASEAMIVRGRADYEADLRTYARCLEADEWPGLSETPVIIDLPKWA